MVSLLFGVLKICLSSTNWSLKMSHQYAASLCTIAKECVLLSTQMECFDCGTCSMLGAFSKRKSVLNKTKATTTKMKMRMKTVEKIQIDQLLKSF